MASKLNRRQTLAYLKARKRKPSLIEGLRRSMDMIQLCFLKLDIAIQKAKNKEVKDGE